MKLKQLEKCPKKISFATSYLIGFSNDESYLRGFVKTGGKIQKVPHEQK
jgi:hypothetical protein